MEMEMRVTFPGETRIAASYKGFVIKTDQPVYQGGGGSAPSPFDLFLASIGTCSGWYILSFCRERDISLNDASIILKTERDPESKMITKIEIKIQLPPGFPEKYKNAVIKAANLCAVKKHIQDPPVFEVTAT